LFDCDDPDCYAAPACGDCKQKGESCESDAECCSGNCHNRKKKCL
jgi:hypothetical protein